MAANKQLRKVIRRQKEIIAKTGFAPSWLLFSKTFGWFQLKKKLTVEEQQLYQKIWEEE